MNLAIARSIKRYKEVGLRKVVGAHRSQLVLQFIGESVLLAFLALAVALGLVLLIGPVFSAFVERDLSLGLEHAGWLLGLAGLTLLVGVVSGSYPAVFVSSLKPAHVLKGAPTGSARRPRLQQILIVAQFAASIVLVVGSLVIYRQLSYIQHKEMGYSRDHIVVLSTRGEEINNNYETVRAELLRNPNILAVATSGNLPSHISSQTTVRGWEGSTEEDELPIYRTDVGYDFLEVFEVGLAAGRNFSRDFAGDTLGGGLPPQRDGRSRAGLDPGGSRRETLRDVERRRGHRRRDEGFSHALAPHAHPAADVIYQPRPVQLHLGEGERRRPPRHAGRHPAHV
jgi:hypothetical protein